MNRRRRRPSAGTDDRGTTLVEVVVGLFLVAMAAGLLAQLMTSTARSAPDDTVTADAALALDSFARDVREAEYVATVEDRGRVIAVALSSATETIEWQLRRDELVRSDGTIARVMATGLTPSSAFDLRGNGGESIETDDLDAVRWCTRVVELALVGDDWQNSRLAGFRVDATVEQCS